MGTTTFRRALDGNTATVTAHTHNTALFTAAWTETFYAENYSQSFTGTASEVTAVLEAHGFRN